MKPRSVCSATAFSPRTMTLALGCLLAAAGAQAQDKIRIGFITDMSGLYSDVDGKGGALAVQMAVDDFGGKLLGKPVEVLTADHQNKADIAASKAREWFDTQGMSMLIGGTTSSAGLAMGKVADEKKKVYLINGAGTSALTNEQCSPYFVHYAYDTVALAKGTGKAVVELGGKSWFFLTADYAFGQALEADTTRVINASGGKVQGDVKHPLNTADFSSFLLQAQNSRAQILGLANAGGDTINAIKSAREFGLTKTMKLAGLLLFSSDIHSLGLKATEGLMFTDSWHWDLNPESRKFSDRFFARFKKMPTSLQAANYSAAMQYLKLAEKLGTTDADKIMAGFKSTPLSDFYAKGVVRPDGRYAHDMYLLQVKAPAESKKAWDYFKVLKTLPGDQIFTTKEESKCALWK